MGIPVDLGKICSEEGIELAPGQFSRRFHGRIEFLSSEGVFVIFHPTPNGVSEGRIRFTIGHELGHYFIEEHRDLIVAGKAHSSVESFAPVRTRIEREADWFASSLLMPEKKVREIWGSRGYLDAQGILRIAKTCQTTPRASAFRYSEVCDEPCVIIFADSGAVQCSFHSGEAEVRGFGGLGINQIPSKSAARECLLGEPWKAAGKQADSTEWFSARRAYGKLWEDSVRLGAGSRTLTMLSWLDYKPER
ncbi:MAG: ImmA/IrrE family metallo-endopeptidase, partial [Verrucomicrobiales bacterium]